MSNEVYHIHNQAYTSTCKWALSSVQYPRRKNFRNNKQFINVFFSANCDGIYCCKLILLIVLSNQYAIEVRYRANIIKFYDQQFDLDP